MVRVTAGAARRFRRGRREAENCDCQLLRTVPMKPDLVGKVERTIFLWSIDLSFRLLLACLPAHFHSLISVVVYGQA